MPPAPLNFLPLKRSLTIQHFNKNLNTIILQYIIFTKAWVWLNRLLSDWFFSRAWAIRGSRAVFLSQRSHRHSRSGKSTWPGSGIFLWGTLRNGHAWKYCSTQGTWWDNKKKKNLFGIQINYLKKVVWMITAAWEIIREKDMQGNK